jgi:hypothetical protein
MWHTCQQTEHIYRSKYIRNNVAGACACGTCNKLFNTSEATCVYDKITLERFGVITVRVEK